MMREADVKALAGDIFAQTLEPSVLDRIEVAQGIDHDGDPAFYVTVHFKAGTGVDGATASSSAQTSLRRELLERGEERFPYLRYRFPGDQILRSEDEAGIN